jgi:cysteine synthase
MHGAHASVLQAIGNTPLVRLQHMAPHDGAQILVKLEGHNPTGSSTDRLALSLIEGAERRGELSPGQTVVELTSGSLGASLSLICAMKGYPLSVVYSDAFSQENLNVMRTFGADVTIVPSDSGQITAELFERMRRVVYRLIHRYDAYWTDQFHNSDVLAGYEELGQEIVGQAKDFGSTVDTFCAAVGTGGLLVGTAEGIRSAGQDPRVVALEPATSPVLTMGTGGPHRVEGTSVGAVPPFLATGAVHEARVVKESLARKLAVRLARQEGVLAGISSALNIGGALELAAALGPERTVVTVAPDSGLKHLSTGLFNG